jgi:2-hydroxychromene-2-carboxylate isomerase
MTDQVSDATIWFDPACPFTWRTSRWIRATAPRHGASLTWRLMSLGILNEGKTIPEQYREPMARSVGVRRVLLAAERQGGQDALDRLYTAIGERVHDKGEPIGPDSTRAALADAGLPATLADAADDESLDSDIRASHEAGQARVGTESGSPIVALGDGPGFFGPVVVPIPEGADADRLYEAVQLLSTIPQFSELKRARNSF